MDYSDKNKQMFSGQIFRPSIPGLEWISNLYQANSFSEFANGFGNDSVDKCKLFSLGKG